MNVPPEIDALFRQALNIHQRGSVTHAQTMYEQILAYHPAHFDCCHLLGVTHMQTGSPERAADLISRALTINPESADAHFNLGHALRALGRTDEALASFETAIGLRPGFAEYHLERGIMLQAAGKLPEALACYDEATRLDPTFADGHRRKASLLLRLKRPEEALLSCEEAIRLNHRSAETHSLKGTILTDLDMLEEALTSYDVAIKLNPELAEAFRYRGRILKLLNRLEEAAESYDRAAHLDPDRADTYVYRAAILHALKRHDEALTGCDRAILLNPELAEAHTQRGYALGSLGRMDEALNSFNTAMELKGADRPATLGRAWLHSRCERWALARRDYEEVLSRDKANESAWLGLALLPEGYLTAEIASEILNWHANSLKGDRQASQLFMRSKLLRHLQRYQESFETLRQANDLRLSEISQPDEWRERFDRMLQSAQSWFPKTAGQASGRAVTLLVVLGPSRCGKSTFEELISGDKAFKRGFEGRAAGSAKRSLRDIPLSESSSPDVSSAQVQRRIFAALFSLPPERVLEGEEEVITITNPFLLSAAQLIFDLYPKSYFVFLERDAVDNAAEVYAKDYIHKYPFAYSPRGTLDYVELYKRVSDVLVRKMGHRAIMISYEELLRSPGSVINATYEMLGMAPPENPPPVSALRDTRSAYREMFSALCVEQGIVPGTMNPP